MSTFYEPQNKTQPGLVTQANPMDHSIWRYVVFFEKQPYGKLSDSVF